MTRPALRNGFYAGLLVAVILGLYLFQLWQPERQLHLHSEHLVTALEQQDWAEVRAFLSENYKDQWGHNRELALTQLQQVLHFARNLHIQTERTIAIAQGDQGTWSARIMIQADDNEVASLIKARINVLEEPFVLQWRRQSWKPWDWQLVGVSNPALELPTF